jgi:hypothetical protein
MIQSQGRRAARNVSQNLSGRWLSARKATNSTLERKQDLISIRPPAEKLPRYRLGNGRLGGLSDLPPDERERKHLLKPYDLAMQLKRMCSEGDVNGAIERLKTTPRDAQNVAVWNTMISECLSAERYQLSYELFVDVSGPFVVFTLLVTCLCNR